MSVPFRQAVVCILTASFVLGSTLVEGVAAHAAGRVTELRVEYLDAPVGLDEEVPRFSWVLNAAHRGAAQTAYRILVAKDARTLLSGKPDIWDSGKVSSDENLQIEYGGPPLLPRTRYHVAIELWDEQGRSAVGSPSFFETGKLHEPWQAKWVGLRPSGDDERLPFVGASWLWAEPAPGKTAEPVRRLGFAAKFLVPDFDKVAAADLFIAAPGVGRNWLAHEGHYLWINGTKFNRFSNSSNADWRRIPITHALRAGENDLHLLAAYFENKAIIATIRLRFRDGRERFIQSSERWRVRSFGKSEIDDNWINDATDKTPWRAAEVLGPFGKNVRPADPSLMQMDHVVPPIHLRKGFTTRARPMRARLYVTSVGIHEIHVNGRRVGNEVFAPGWTDYSKRIFYQTHDLTAYLRPGRNTLGAIVADGWAVGRTGMGRHLWGFDKALLAELHLDYADGSHEVIATDGSWLGKTGAIRESDMLDGETVDARRELVGWSNPEGSTPEPDGFRGVSLPKITTGPLVGVKAPPVRAMRTLRVKAMLPARGAQIFDLGQNMVGWVRLVLSSVRAGTRVRVRYAEMLDKKGALYTEALRTANATDEYVARGRGVEVFEPKFTFHGFRYVEVSGLDRAIPATALQGIVAHSDLPRTGTFNTSNPLLNQLQSNIVWGQRGNYLSIPTDCPQRDERLGWTGDIQMFARTGSFNMDSAAFLGKYVDDLVDGQFADGSVPNVVPTIPILGGGAYAWGDALVILPHLLYETYGDKRIIDRHFEAMKKWVDFRSAQAKGFLNTEEGFGDWVAPVKTPDKVAGPIYHARAAWLLSRMAAATGRTAEAKEYATLFEKIVEAFAKAYVLPDGKIESDTQTAYVLALRYGILSAAEQPRAMAHLVAAIARSNQHLATGFLGSGHLLPVLSSGRQNALAYKLLLNETYPSWLYTVKSGATTMWERWDGYSPTEGPNNKGDMNSYNHYAFGSVGEWMYANIAGIDHDPEIPGWKAIVIRPRLGGGLTRARAEYRSPRGTITTNWRISSNRFVMDVQIPVHGRATVILPVASDEGVLEGGQPVVGGQARRDVKALGAREGGTAYTISSGNYQFSAPMPR